jgi:hypothetical protein
MSRTLEIEGEPWQPGMVVLAWVRNPFENPLSTGKIRPVVLVEREGGHWRVMGLTTKSRYRSGQKRVAVPAPTQVGLNGPGYLWGDGLTPVCALDLERPIGWCDLLLAEAIADLAHLPYLLRRGLTAAAQLRNPMPPRAA